MDCRRVFAGAVGACTTRTGLGQGGTGFVPMPRRLLQVALLAGGADGRLLARRAVAIVAHRAAVAIQQARDPQDRYGDDQDDEAGHGVLQPNREIAEGTRGQTDQDLDDAAGQRQEADNEEQGRQDVAHEAHAISPPARRPRLRRRRRGAPSITRTPAGVILGVRHAYLLGHSRKGGVTMTGEETGGRGQALAARFSTASDALIATVAGCPDERWMTMCPDEQQPVGVVARHVASALPIALGWVRMVVDGQPLPPLTPEQLADFNLVQHVESHLAGIRKALAA